MARPYRILRILNRLNIGGPIYNAVYLTEYLSPEFETTLAAGSYYESEGDSSYIAKERGINPVVVPNMVRPIRPIPDFKAYRFLRRLIRELKPDIVHTHGNKSGAVGRLAAAHERVPVIVHTIHGNYFQGYFSAPVLRVLLEVERYLGRKSHAIIAISQLQKRELADQFRVAPADKIRVIPNGFELGRFSEDFETKRAAFQQQYQLPKDKVLVGIVGRMVPIKNHSLFLHAFRALKEKSSQPVHGVLIGDGELRAEVEATATQLGLNIHPGDPDRDLTFTSWITRIDTAYPGLDILALTSDNEGTPVSLVEAQAAGLPVVSTNVGGVLETLQDNLTGFATPPGNAEAITQRLLQLVENPALRRQMGSAGQAFVHDRYGVERLVRDMGALYRELLG